MHIVWKDNALCSAFIFYISGHQKSFINFSRTNKFIFRCCWKRKKLFFQNIVHLKFLVQQNWLYTDEYLGILKEVYQYLTVAQHDWPCPRYLSVTYHSILNWIKGSIRQHTIHSNDKTPLDLALMYRQHAVIYLLFKENGAMNTLPVISDTLSHGEILYGIHRAAMQGQVDTIKYLIHIGCNVNELTHNIYSSINIIISSHTSVQTIREIIIQKTFEDFITRRSISALHHNYVLKTAKNSLTKSIGLRQLTKTDFRQIVQNDKTWQKKQQKTKQKLMRKLLRCKKNQYYLPARKKQQIHQFFKKRCR